MATIPTPPFAGNPSSAIAAAWHDRAPELAEWAMARFVVRTDCYGAYTPPVPDDLAGRIEARLDADAPPSRLLETLARVLRRMRGSCCGAPRRPGTAASRSSRPTPSTMRSRCCDWREM